MPLYEYRCPACSFTLEKLEPYKSVPPECPRCATAEMERQIAQTGPWRFGGRK